MRSSFTENGQRELEHPHLRLLSVRNQIFDTLTLKTPKLEVLHCRQAQGLQLEHPETIKTLDCDLLSGFVLEQFVSLEKLKCTDIDDPDPRRLLACRNLRELDLRLHWTTFGSEKYAKFLSFLRRALTRTGQMKICLNDVRLLDVSQLEDIDCMRNTAKFHLKNYKMESGNHAYWQVHAVNYSDLMSWHSELSGDFFEKFPSIETVEVSERVDLDHFGWFLRNVRHLRRLILTGVWLEPEFLLSTAGGLNDLQIFAGFNGTFPSPATTTFDFILNFESLAKFRTDLPFLRPVDLAEKLFEKFEHFNLFEFKADSNERVTIQRANSTSMFERRFKVAFCATKNGADEKTFCRPDLNWACLVELCESRNFFV